MESLLRLKLNPAIEMVEIEDGYVLHGTFIEFPLKNQPRGVLAVMERLAHLGATDAEIKQTLAEVDGGQGTMSFFALFPRLMRLGFISHMLEVDGVPAATIKPISPYYNVHTNEVNPEDTYQLSRFAYLHREGDELLLECSLAYAQIQLHDPRMGVWISALSRPYTYQGLAELLPELDAEAAKLFYRLLLSAKSLVRVEEGQNTEEQDIVLQQWEFHDLLFHTRSRAGRLANPLGGNYRFAGKIDPLPVTKTPMSENVTPLPTPDLEVLKADDFSLADVMESRVSTRQFSQMPLTVDQLGEFLFRSARIRHTFLQEVEGPHGKATVEHSSRPYPSGGASYELEIYPIIHRCEGLLPGLYHYRPDEHALGFLEEQDKKIEQLLTQAVATWDPTLQADFPAVMFVITARFQRVTWKYDSLSYAVMLKNVGVLMQTMYLNATAMGLGACALGGGNSDLFTAILGENYYAETSIGEFIVGHIAQ